MNLDVNTLSAVMQLLGKGNADLSALAGMFAGGNTSGAAVAGRPAQSADTPFVRQNRIGERIDFSSSGQPKDASILNMLKGGTDMSNMLPMLLGMLKPAAKTSTAKAEEKRDTQSQAAAEYKAQPKQNSKGTFAPISFAGYPAISALNVLYKSKRTC